MADTIRKKAKPAVSIGVGDIKDYTGKYSTTEGSTITQGGTLMVYSALGKLGDVLQVHERFDTRIAELELAYTDKRQLGDGRNYTVEAGKPPVPWIPYFGGSIIRSQYYIVGGITEVNYNIQSAGGELSVNGVGVKRRTYTMNVGVDLRIVDNANLLAPTAGSTFTLGPPNVPTTNADYGVLNVQTQTGAVKADTSASARIDLSAGGGSTIATGTASVTGNEFKAVAQATEATNTLNLTGTKAPISNITDVTAALVSIQNTDAAVTATQTVNAAATSFGVLALSSSATPIAVSNNAITTSAGQNQAFNQLTVKATNMSGGTAGDGVTSYDPGFNTAAVGTAKSVLNVQNGAGNVTATATPRLVGANIGTITDGSLSVNSNTILVRANVNQATNGLDLEAGGVMATTGAIANAQNTALNAVLATLTTATVGSAGGVTFSGTTLTVQGNTLTALAGGNTSANALNATAGTSIAASATSPTFQALNYQGNLSSVNAVVTAIGLGVPTAATSFTNTTSSVLANQLVASAFANSSTNNIGLSALTGGLNQASAAVTNGQFNSGNIGATLSSITAGLFGGAASGGSMVVSGNTFIAQVIANSAVSRIFAR